LRRGTIGEIDAAFAAFMRERADALTGVEKLGWWISLACVACATIADSEVS